MLQEVIQRFVCNWTADRGEAPHTSSGQFRCFVRRTATLAARSAFLVIGNGAYNGRTFTGQFLVPSAELVKHRHWRTEAEEIFHQWCRENVDKDAFVAG